MKQTKTRVWGAVLLAAVLIVLVFATGVSASDATGQGQYAVAILPESRIDPIGPVENIPLDVNAIITANCRYGLTGAEPYASWLATQNVGLGWYGDFLTHQPTNWVPGAEYVQAIFVRQDRDSNGNYLQTYTSEPPPTGSLGYFVRLSPGSLWIVGNEPDRGPTVPTDPNRIQGDTYPDVYAKAYHDIYETIKANDPTAQVAVAGLVEVTPGRLNYWDQVWQSYQNRYGTTMPVDVWNMHLYVLPEVAYDGSKQSDIGGNAKGVPLSMGRREGIYGWVGPESQVLCSDASRICIRDHDDMGEFANQVLLMRNWMKNKGQQNKPLIITEFSILYSYGSNPNPNPPTSCWVHDEWGNCFAPSRVSQFLQNTFNYLNTAADANIGYPRDNNRLVQQWLWFDMYRPSGSVGSVSNIAAGTTPQSLSQVGNTFKSLVNDATKFPQTFNFVATNTQFKSLTPGPSGFLATVSVGAYNNGSITPAAPVTVTAYADAARTQVLGSGVFRGVRGCARREYSTDVTLNLPTLASGTVNYWITINPGNVGSETATNDNFTQGSLVVPNVLKRMFVPLIVH